MVARKPSKALLSRGLIAGAVIVVLGMVPVPAAAAPSGDLDPTFGHGGQVATAFGGYGGAADVAMVGGGRILVAGSFDPPHAPERIGLARYLPNGHLDPAFGGDGRVSIGFAGGAIMVSALVVLPGGGFVVGGTFDPKGSTVPTSFALARFHQDGRLDTTFAGDGRVVADLGGDWWYLNDVVRQSNGKLVAAGQVYREDPDGFSNSFALARFSRGGSVDASFGNGGRVVTSFPVHAEDARPTAGARSLTIDVADRIVAVGSAGWNGFDSCNIDWALARYRPDGTLDRTFGGDGRVVTPMRGNVPSATAVQVGDDNRLTVAGYERDIGCAEDSPPETGAGVVARYFPGGTLDRTFGGDGKVRAPFFGSVDAEASFQGMILEEGGQVVAAGTAQQPSSGREVVIAAAYLRNGHPNTDFSGNGRAWAAGPLDYAAGSALFEDPDGRPVVVGTTVSGGTTGRFLIERFKASG